MRRPVVFALLLFSMPLYAGGIGTTEYCPDKLSQYVTDPNNPFYVDSMSRHGEVIALSVIGVTKDRLRTLREVQFYDRVQGKTLSTIQISGREVLKHAYLSPNGRSALIVTNNAYRTYDVRSGELTEELYVYPDQREKSRTNLADWSPDGRLLAYTKGEGRELYVATPGSLERPRLVFENRRQEIRDFKFSPDGSLLAVLNGPRTIEIYDAVRSFAAPAGNGEAQNLSYLRKVRTHKASWLKEYWHFQWLDNRNLEINFSAYVTDLNIDTGEGREYYAGGNPMAIWSGRRDKTDILLDGENNLVLAEFPARKGDGVDRWALTADGQLLLIRNSGMIEIVPMLDPPLPR